MKTIRELLALQEETLQQAVKRLLKTADDLTAVMGPDAQTAAELLQGKTSDDAYVIKGDSPLEKKMLAAVANGRSFDTAATQKHGTVKLMRMPGGARLLVVGQGDDAFIVTTAHMRDQLVESRV